MSYKSDLQQNNADLQSILDDVNNLPVAENISDLLDEQETKLNELLTVLDGKAAGGGDGEKYHTLRYLLAEDYTCYILSSPTEFMYATAPGDYDVYGGVFMFPSTDFSIDCYDPVTGEDADYAVISIAGWTVVKANGMIVLETW